MCFLIKCRINFIIIIYIFKTLYSKTKNYEKMKRYSINFYVNIFFISNHYVLEDKILLITYFKIN